MFYLNPKDNFLFSCSETCFLIAAVCNICSILICFCCSSDKHCPELMDFLHKGITFATVDITNDKLNMRHNFGIEIPTGCLIDLQTVFRLRHVRTSMAHMAVALIDEEYGDMKTSFPKSQHKLWEKAHLILSTLSMQQKMHTFHTSCTARFESSTMASVTSRKVDILI